MFDASLFEIVGGGVVSLLLSTIVFMLRGLKEDAELGRELAEMNRLATAEMRIELREIGRRMARLERAQDGIKVDS